MAKALVTSAKALPAEPDMSPVADDEIDPEAMEEIIRRVERMRRGEDGVFSNEEALRSLGFDPERIRELLDQLT